MKFLIFHIKYPKNDISWPRNGNFPAAYRGKDHLEKPRASRSPGGGGDSGGMVAHDLVNGWQATA